MCFKKLARVAVGAGVGFLTGGPLGAVVGGTAAAVVKGKSVIGGAALGAAGGFGSALVFGGLSGVTGAIGKVAGSPLGKAVIGAAGSSFGQAQQAGTGALITSPVPVGSAVPVSGSAAGGIMTAPVAGIDDEDNVNLGIKMAMNINDSFNRALE